jgi:hypothetical protein
MLSLMGFSIADALGARDFRGRGLLAYRFYARPPSRTLFAPPALPIDSTVMTDRVKLLEVLRDASKDLPDVIEKKMFGCEALFTTGGIFALVWKTGRIGVKLPIAARYEALASQKGAAPWTAGPKTMAHWVLVPPKLETSRSLEPWLREAHAMAGVAPEKKRAAKKAAGGSKKKSAVPAPPKAKRTQK